MKAVMATVAHIHIQALTGVQSDVSNKLSGKPQG